MTATRKKKILIFDNSEILVNMMTTVMIDEGYEAMGVPFTANYMRVIEDYKPDLLLLDHQRSIGFNTYELGLQVKVNPQTLHIPVIMLSVYEFQETSHKHPYVPDMQITKPFSLTELTLQIEKLLAT